MEIKKIKIGEKSVLPFTIPSGIITTSASGIEAIANSIPEIGIITTKSTGIEPRQGYSEPIIHEYSRGCFINAVGLANPGAEALAEELSAIDFPEDKFLLASIFGRDAGEFVRVAKTLEEFADGFELNFSCPNVANYGSQIGENPLLVYEITSAVCQDTEKPVFAKFGPKNNNLSEAAILAVKGGAYGISAINTAGPGEYLIDGHPVLSNKYGGLSGEGILPIGLRCVSEIRKAVGEEPLIIGIGGIRCAADVERYHDSGADIFGIGSALSGLDNSMLKKYFSALADDLRNRTDNASSLLIHPGTAYHKTRIEAELMHAPDFKTIYTDLMLPEAGAGQFVFAWIPGVGEKPFSLVDNNPVTLGVMERGCFTKAFSSMKKGDSLYIRGPYGRKPEMNYDCGVFLVGGGSGIAALPMLARQAAGEKHDRIVALLGAKDSSHIPYIKELERICEVFVATEDGSIGEKGNVLSLFGKAKAGFGYYFNCGPKEMVRALIPVESRFSCPELIFSSVDYLTKCGIGLCGSCTDETGRRSCTEGPFMHPE